jgi:hypothetical protein
MSVLAAQQPAWQAELCQRSGPGTVRELVAFANAWLLHLMCGVAPGRPAGNAPQAAFPGAENNIRRQD